MLLELLYELPLSARAALAISCLLVLRHFWMFTLKPLVHPQDPKLLPYWIPYIGHALAFFRSSDKLLEYGLNYMGRTREMFALQIMGKKLYIVTDPTDVTTVFRNNSTLSFDGQLGRLLTNFGVKPEALKKAWHKPEPGSWDYIPDNSINPQQLDFIHLLEVVWKKQLGPGEHEAKLCRAFLNSACKSLWFGGDGLLDKSIIPSADRRAGGKGYQVLLYSLCRETIVEAVTRSLFGNHLHNINPDIVEDMGNFNQHVWMVIFQYGTLFFDTPVSKPRKRLMDTLVKFIETPPRERGDEAWAVKQMLAAMEITDIDVESRASILLMCYWAAVSNEYNVTFWILATLLYDENLMRIVEKETAAAWKPALQGDSEEQLDIRYLCSSLNSPQLTALFHETLRLRNGAATIREVTKSTIINGKKLQQGNFVMIPFRLLHLDEKVWGSTATTFDAARFMENGNGNGNGGGGESLLRHPSYRPFGGGKTLCPGRLLGMEEVLGFIAILLRRFEIRLLAARVQGKDVEVKTDVTVLKPPPPFPRINDLVPSVGVSGPMIGTDLVVEVVSRVN